MNSPTRRFLQVIFSAVLCCGSMAVLAMPKAAEHEDAPVTSGENAARPKHSSTVSKPPVAKNAKPASKATKSGKPSKAGKASKAGGKSAKTADASRPAKTSKTAQGRK